MSAVDIERLHYFPGQYLGALDFDAEQLYHRDMRRRHNVGHHAWGIVVGLELNLLPAPSGGGVEAWLMPGLAIDGYGREILVAGPTKLDPYLFSSFASPGLRTVFIAYSEEFGARAPLGVA